MASRASTFTFKEPDQLQNSEFDFSQYTEFFEQDETTEQMLINYILKEAENFRAGQLEDVSK